MLTEADVKFLIAHTRSLNGPHITTGPRRTDFDGTSTLAIQVDDVRFVALAYPEYEGDEDDDMGDGPAYVEVSFDADYIADLVDEDVSQALVKKLGDQVTALFLELASDLYDGAEARLDIDN